MKLGEGIWNFGSLEQSLPCHPPSTVAGGKAGTVDGGKAGTVDDGRWEGWYHRRWPVRRPVPSMVVAGNADTVNGDRWEGDGGR